MPVMSTRGVSFQDECDRQRVRVDRIAKIGQGTDQHLNLIEQLTETNAGVSSCRLLFIR